MCYHAIGSFNRYTNVIFVSSLSTVVVDSADSVFGDSAEVGLCLLSTHVSSTCAHDFPLSFHL